MQTAPDEDALVPNSVLDRAALILDSFVGRQSMSVADLVQETGLPKSSTHRIVDKLVRMRMLARTDGGQYRLGLKLAEVGARAVHQDPIHIAASEHVNQLHRLTGMTVHLAVLDGSDVIYLDKVGGLFNQAVPTRVGGRLPAEDSALGRAILAYSVDREVTARELIRDRGYAVHSDDVAHGIGCVAAPIGPMGSPAAAISVCGPKRQVLAGDALADPVRAAAEAIWRNIAGNGRVVPVLQQRNRLQQRESVVSDFGRSCG